MNLMEELERLRQELEIAEAEDMAKRYPTLEPDKVTIALGKKWHKLNIGTSGAFMVNVETGMVHGIKAYGVPHPKVIHGRIDQITGAQLLPRRWARAGTPPIKPILEGES